MRKKEYKELKESIIAAWVMFILFFGIILCLAQEYIIAIWMILIVTVMFGSVYVVLVISNKINLFLKKKNIPKRYKKHERDIPKRYTVSMASLLLDNVFEDKIDIPAIILSLIGKNILIYENNKLQVRRNADISKLFNHEKYLYKCIEGKKKVETNKFRKLVIEDTLKIKYIKKNTPKDPLKKALIVFLGLPILIFVYAIIASGLPKFLYCSIGFGLGVCAIMSPMAIFNKYQLDNENPYKNTILGNIEVKKLLGLKRYLKNYSMIDNKKIKEAIVWEDYLAYAYIFGINKKIFEEFKGLKQINNIVN